MDTYCIRTFVKAFTIFYVMDLTWDLILVDLGDM